MMDITAILDRVSRGEDVEGYRVVETGVDADGIYYLIEGPTGKIYRYTRLRPSVLREMPVDRYNKIHRYRRPGDKVMLYYNTAKEHFQILAVKDGDDLAAEPFCLEDSFCVGKHSNTSSKGLVEINEEEMTRLTALGVMSQRDAEVILAMKNNVGFYLAKKE